MTIEMTNNKKTNKMKNLVKKTLQRCIPRKKPLVDLAALCTEISDEVVSSMQKMSLANGIEFDSMTNKAICIAEIDRVVKAIPKKYLLDYQKTKDLQIPFSYSRVHLKKDEKIFIISKIVLNKKNRSKVTINYILRNNFSGKDTKGIYIKTKK